MKLHGCCIHTLQVNHAIAFMCNKLIIFHISISSNLTMEQCSHFSQQESRKFLRGAPIRGARQRRSRPWEEPSDEQRPEVQQGQEGQDSAVEDHSFCILDLSQGHFNAKEIPKFFITWDLRLWSPLRWGRRKGKQNRDRGNGRRGNSRSGRNNGDRRWVGKNNQHIHFIEKKCLIWLSTVSSDSD